MIPAALRSYVYARDEGRCQRCGRDCLEGPHSIQHRRPRQMGGDRNADTAANLVLMCGTGTTGCHGHVESHRSDAHDQGWLVHRWEDPALKPVLRYGRTWSVLGSAWTRMPNPEAAQLRAELEATRAQLALASARRTTGGIPPAPDTDWANLARTPAPDTASDPAAPPHHRPTREEVS